MQQSRSEAARQAHGIGERAFAFTVAFAVLLRLLQGNLLGREAIAPQAVVGEEDISARHADELERFTIRGPRERRKAQRKRQSVLPRPSDFHQRFSVERVG